MNKQPTTKKHESRTAVDSQARLESTRLPPLEQVTPQIYARLSSKQRRALVGKLIEFLKTF